MAKQLFYRQVDLRSRSCMVEFLEKHSRYFTMNGCSTSYAQNMKIHELDLSSEIKEKLWNVRDCENFWERIHELCDRFGAQHNYEWQACFNGDYLVLYMGDVIPDMFIYLSPGIPIDMNIDFDDWSMDELRERVHLVQEFDQLADDIVNEAVEMAEKFSNRW